MMIRLTRRHHHPERVVALPELSVRKQPGAGEGEHLQGDMPPPRVVPVPVVREGLCHAQQRRHSHPQKKISRKK